MTEEEIHNIYVHMAGKAEGIAEAGGSADFPVLFANAILKFNRTDDREWVGLTQQEFLEVTDGVWDLEDCWTFIEAKLKEKNA